MVKGKKLTKKDRKHLNDFGEIHPADLESERMKNEIKEKKLDGTYKEKFLIIHCDPSGWVLRLKTFKFMIHGRL